MTDISRPARPRRRGRTAVLVALLAVALLVVAVVGVVAVRGHGAPRLPGLVGLPAFGVTDPAGPAAENGDLGGASVGVRDDVPAVSRLDPALLGAVRAAAAEAAADGVELRITSGWRSPAFQQQLLDRAVVRYGSLAEALRWVATPERSRHVTGNAVDVGPTDAAYWMSEHGADHGLCQTYANEIWHYELVTAPGGDCPPMGADGTG